ncbi:hypothetical protein, partial [Alistipes finegoldii]|uniref:hypothetical protein n=2 Tax=Alistipes TaxID=239759 RepID=UPI002FDCEBE1
IIFHKKHPKSVQLLGCSTLSVAFFSPPLFSPVGLSVAFFRRRFFLRSVSPSPFFFVAVFLSPVFFSPVAFFVCRPSFLQLFPTLFLWDGRRRDSLRTRPEGLFQRFFAANVTKLLNIFKIFIKYLRNSKTPRIFAVKF